MSSEPLKRDPEQPAVARELAVDLLTRFVVIADEHGNCGAGLKLQFEFDGAGRPLKLHATVRHGGVIEGTGMG